jgi:hypothetical protein
MNSQIDFSVKLRRTHGGFETSLPQRFMVHTLIGVLVDLSLTQAPRGRNPKGENENGGGKGDGGSLILFNRAITQSQFCPWIQMSQTI